MSNVFNSGSAEFSNPYSGIIGATDFSTDIYPSINNAIASGGGGSTPQPYIGTWIATDFESNTIPSVNNTLQKIDNFQPSTLNQTNINGKLTTTDDITSTKFIVQGGTNIQYLLADGTLLTSSANSGNSNFYLYKSTDNATTPPIGSGNIVYNNAIQSLATVIYVSHLTRDNVDIEIFFENVSSLNDLYIQDQNNSLNYIRYNITGTPTIVPNDYVLIPVIINTSGGTGSTSFGTNHNVLLSIFTNSIETDVRISNLETKTQNQTAVLGTTTLSGSLTMSGNTITNLATPILGTDATNKSYVDTITQNIATNYQWLLIQSTLSNNNNNISIIHNANLSYGTTKYYPQPNVLNYVSCILPDISTLPNRDFPENYLRIGFIDETNFPLGYVAYLSIFNVAGVASYNISWGNNEYDPIDYQFAAGDRVQITIDGFTNEITYVISGAFPNSQIRPYIGGITQIKMTVGFLQTSPASATGNIYTFSNVIFTQSAPISISNVGTGNTLINTSKTPAYTVKSVSVSGTGISTSTSTTTNLIISSTALPTTGGTMTGAIAMGANKITSTYIPIANDDLTNKLYVDSYILPFKGYPFNTTQNSTISTTAGNKSFFYMIPINRPTIISGFRIYIATGSDNLRFGIYRGFIKGSPLSTATLVGQSAITPASTSLPLCSGAINPVIGQNLSFTTGEYMLIGFGSAGSTNIYLTSQNLTSLGVDIAFTSSTNYVVGGFLATMTTTQQSTPLAIKICFELI